MNNPEKKSEFLAGYIQGTKIYDMGADSLGSWAWPDGKTLHNHLENKTGKKIISVDKFGKPDIQTDLNDILPIKSNSADTIIASEVIEHLTNPFLFLSECKRIIKPEVGTIILTTPNALSLAEFQQYWTSAIHGREYGEHLFNWHRINMDNLIKEVGLEIIHFEYISFHWKRNYLFRFLSHFIPILRPSLFYILRKKR